MSARWRNVHCPRGSSLCASASSNTRQTATVNVKSPPGRLVLPVESEVSSMTEAMFVERGDLAWALGAVMPHHGARPPRRAPYVGLQVIGDWLYAYATDTYTYGVAELPIIGGTPIPSPIWLPSGGKADGEAGELRRFTDPGGKAKEHHRVLLAVLPDEHSGLFDLHAALEDEVGEDGDPLSDMFELAKDGIEVHDLLSWTEHFVTKLGEETRNFVFNAKKQARFSTAERNLADDLTWYPHMSHRGDATVAVVTVGDHFLGGIQGKKRGGVDMLDHWVNLANREGTAA